MLLAIAYKQTLISGYGKGVAYCKIGKYYIPTHLILPNKGM